MDRRLSWLCWELRGRNSAKMDYIGKLGASTVSAATAIIVRFADGQILEFQSQEEARGFIAFYNSNQSARAQNRAKIYLFKSGAWQEQSDWGKM